MKNDVMIISMMIPTGNAAIIDTVCRLVMEFSEKISASGSRIIITGVQDLEVSQIKDVLHIKFTLVTDVGSKEVEMDV